MCIRDSYYLDALSPEKSTAQNIEELCFRKGALLTLEFKNLFNSLFKNADQYEQIIIALSSKLKGLTRKEIIKTTGRKSGGSLTRLLEELEESGFITKYTPFNKKKQEVLFRLSDFYSLFYLKFIKDNTNFDEGVWTNSIDHPFQRAWSGYAFEQVCLSHIPQIKKALGISGVISQSSSWKSKTSDIGSQIDILIDRRDQVVNLCEVKYSIHPFMITKSYAANLRNKIGTFREETKTRKAIFLTMITTYGVKQNAYANGLVQNDIRMDALFE